MSVDFQKHWLTLPLERPAVLPQSARRGILSKVATRARMVGAGHALGELFPMLNPAHTPPTSVGKAPVDARLWDDAKLAQRVAAGDASALEMLYDRYAAAVMGLAMKSLNQDRTTAEEVVQEVFWRVWTNAGSFNANSGKFSSWLFGITRNLCIDIWRQSNSRPQPVFNDDQEEQLRQQVNPEANVVETVWTTMKHKQVKTAIDVLPIEQRQVIELAYFWGMTRQEISEALGIPLGTVHTRARLALKKLREALALQGLGDE